MSNNAFPRSAGRAAVNGALLLLVALAIGVFLVRQTPDRASNDVSPKPTKVVAADTTAVTGETSAEGVVTTTIAPTLRAPEVVKVLVANGSGVNRAGARVRAFLVPVRYDLPAAADATLRNYEDFVYFNPGFELEARDIASKLGIVKAPIPVPANVVKPPVPAFDVLVMVGPDLAVRFKTQSLTPGATTTVAATTTAAQ